MHCDLFADNHNPFNQFQRSHCHHLILDLVRSTVAIFKMRSIDRLLLSVLLMFACHMNFVHSIEEIIEIQATNFEMVLSSYRYAAILFHDSSTTHLFDEWKKAAELPALKAISDSDCIMAHMNADDPEIEEVKLTYALSTPGIKIFRRGIMSDWRGPFEANAIASWRFCCFCSPC